MDFSTSVQEQQLLCVLAPVAAEGEPLFSGISRPKEPTFSIALGHLCSDERRFDFHAPIDLHLSFEVGVWICQWDGIESVGSDATEACMSFCEDFSVLWEEIAQAKDDELTKKAQETKRRMLEVVKSVN
jgi:hypothetical protein